MHIEQSVKKIIAEIKNMDLSLLNFTHDSNFIEEINLNSFELVQFIDKLEIIFSIDFGIQAMDFNSLKSWSKLLSNIENKINKE
ncbi:MAG: hypothetical protein WCC83_03660 [Candidatus Rickettsiella isopodorum]